MNKPNLCERIQERASLYLDGRLQAPVRRRIQEHLRECVECIEEYRSLRRLSRLAGEMPTVRAPRGLSRRVNRALSQRRQHTLSRLGGGSWSVRVTRSGLAAAAAFLVLLPAVGVYLGYGLGRRDGAARHRTQVERGPGSWAWLPRVEPRAVPEAVAQPEPPAVGYPGGEPPAADPLVPIDVVPAASPALPAVLAPPGRVPAIDVLRDRSATRGPPFESSWWFETVEMFEFYESYQSSERGGTHVRLRVQTERRSSNDPERPRVPQR